MIDIQQSPKHNYNSDRYSKPGCLPCVVCGKAITKPKHYLHLFWGATAVTETEAAEIIAKQGAAGDTLFYPVGSDCLRQHPELKPYVIEVSERSMATTSARSGQEAME